MTKKKHPISRAERLASKQDGTVQYTRPTHAKKRIKESLTDAETKAELTRAARFNEYGAD